MLEIQAISSEASMPESDVLVHIEDTPLVTAIRDGRLIELSWNALTDDERRAANCVTFQIYE